MPLTARLNGAVIDAGSFDADAWTALREMARSRPAALLLACGREASLRRSPAGTRHFVHRRNDEVCAWGHAPMSAEHAQLQRLVLDGAAAAGWQAEAEVPGTQWRADVLATHPRYRRPVAFEVQWTTQSLDEYRHRQARYEASHVQAVWLCRRLPAPSAELGDVRALALEQAEDGFRVLLGTQGLPVQSAVEQLLRGRWRHLAVTRAQVQSSVATLAHVCWSCGRRMLLWCVVAEEITTAHGLAQSWWRRRRFGNAVFEINRREAAPAVVAAVQAAAASGRIPTARLRRSWTQASGQNYDAFHCPSCSMVQGETFLEEGLYAVASAERSLLSSDVMHSALAPLPHWCDGACAAATGG